jgi:hypothetical protein
VAGSDMGLVVNPESSAHEAKPIGIRARKRKRRGCFMKKPRQTYNRQPLDGMKTRGFSPIRALQNDSAAHDSSTSLPNTVPFPGVEVSGTVEVSSNLVDWCSGSAHTTVVADNGSFFKTRAGDAKVSVSKSKTGRQETKGFGFGWTGRIDRMWITAPMRMPPFPLWLRWSRGSTP